MELSGKLFKKICFPPCSFLIIKFALECYRLLDFILEVYIQVLMLSPSADDDSILLFFNYRKLSNFMCFAHLILNIFP